MAETVDVTFEEVRAGLEGLPVPVGDDREVFWVTARELGIARTSLGVCEVFMVGPRLVPRTSIVRRHLEHGEWQGLGAERFLASRIVLPSAPHFVSIAALIAVELRRAGLGSRPLQDAFDDVEPIIELALRRGALPEESIVGLLGELLAVEQALLAVQAHPELRSAVLDMWRGHEGGERDLVVGRFAVEVKTTRTETSSHHISGLGQVEAQVRDDGTRESLLLLSVGIASTQVDGFTLPHVVDRMLALLREPGLPSGVSSPLQKRLLGDIESYGSGGRGYQHDTMAGWGVYRTEYRLTFTPRLYDMDDPEVRVLRRSDLVGTFVSPEELRFRLDLPERVNGLNPAPSWQRQLSRMVREALGLASQ